MVSEDVRGVFELLLAETWLDKCEISRRYVKFLQGMRNLLEEESHLALRRGDVDDAWLFAAHVSLLNDIRRLGLAVVQAEIIRATRQGVPARRKR